MFVCLYFCQSVSRSVDQSVVRSVSPSVCQSVGLSVCRSVGLSVCKSVSLLVGLFFFLSIRLYVVRWAVVTIRAVSK